MNKMTKGALATGLDVALLLGGGGTLAVWNKSVAEPAGTITSGDLELTAGTGT
ncbi:MULTISPECIES: alternate-type signal peptide domain-containing protein [Paeniglutamicibacter]|uniref:Alternate signal-mediated exported protein n=1 Tax=Paeniglutamicibacter sulfureus TaxID=43666 RepID=A0ABU2BM94_9MICC|nr:MULTISPECIES: alternate-type signal peptide domain-containing protein [Paeniglutamicibacter]MCV9995810.1 alternate-type signal peptide domain-containing protein [Paeniglutamicibacter sp. ZC-3]MDR7358459.1 alternate signal-mediated exported protein [Paeniglutamicibacter sulfureus]